MEYSCRLSELELQAGAQNFSPSLTREEDRACLLRCRAKDFVEAEFVAASAAVVHGQLQALSKQLTCNRVKLPNKVKTCLSFSEVRLNPPPMTTLLQLTNQASNCLS